MPRSGKLKQTGLFCPFQAPGHPLEGGCQRTCALYDDEAGGCALLVIARALSAELEAKGEKSEKSK